MQHNSMARGSCEHALVSESACSTTPWLVAVVNML